MRPGAPRGTTSLGVVEVRTSSLSRVTGRVPTRLELSAPLRRLHYHKLTHILQRGTSVLELHALSKGRPPGDPNNDDIAATTTGFGGVELEAFDTDRDRVGGPRTPGRSSLDNPSSAASQALQASKAAGTVAKMAHAPAPIGFVLSEAPTLVKAVRRIRHLESDEFLRRATFRIQFNDGASADFSAPRTDRPLYPHPVVEANDPTGAVRVVENNVNVLVEDVMLEVDASVGGRQTVTGVAITSTIELHQEKAVGAYRAGYVIPIQIRQLRFDSGPAQFVRRVSSGQVP